VATAAPAPATETKKEQVALIPLEHLHPAADNVRRQVGDVVELAETIKAVGIQQPLVVTPRDGAKGYLVVFGHRRLAGAALAGLDEVPCIVREYDERGRLLAMTVENVQRENLSPSEEADAYKRLADLGLSQREIAAQVGRTQGHVSKRLSLLDLPGPVRAQIDAGGITVAGGVALARLKDHPTRLRQASRSNDIESAVARQVEELEREKKVRAEQKAAHDEGLTVIELTSVDAYGYNLEPPAGAIAIVKNGGWNVLKLDPAKHAGEPCHAVAIHPRTLERRAYCTDRTRHPKAKTLSEEQQMAGGHGISKAERERAEKESVARERAEASRRAFIANLLAAKKPPKEAVERIAYGLLGLAEYDGYEDEAEFACQLLGLLPFETSEEEEAAAADGGAEEPLPFELLYERAATSEGELVRVGLAMALALGERQPYHMRESRGRHLRFLEQLGYKLSVGEKKKLS
jgi:ParB family transcriptional regulator, chromosome partitioning protein